MVVLCMAAFAAAVLAAALTGVSVLWALLFGCVCFAAAALSRGHRLPDVLHMMLHGTKKSVVVLKVFCLIGPLTGAWRAAGTIPFFVYWGTRLIAPGWFYICAFLITSFLSFLLGTSFGTVGTIGVTMLLLARSGGGNPLIAAGAVLSGAYFGDRCAPTSSSAHLVAGLTRTDVYENIKGMFQTGAAAFLLASLFYAALSRAYPLAGGETALVTEIAARYNLSLLTALPAALILLLPLLRVDIKLSMGVSTLAAALVAVFLQGEGAWATLRTLFLGYQPAYTGALAGILAGGGLVSMAKAAAIILIASTYAGIIDEAHLFDGLDAFLERAALRAGAYPVALAVSIPASMLACNQTLAVILTQQLMARANARMAVSPREEALQLEDTAVLTAPLIPWNIAVAVPLALMDVTAGAILFAAYLYLLPLTRLVAAVTKKEKKVEKHEKMVG